MSSKYERTDLDKRSYKLTTKLDMKWNSPFWSLIELPHHALDIIPSNRMSTLSLSFFPIIYYEHHTHSKFVSLGKTKATRQSDELGAIESIEHMSCEYGSMNISLAQIDFTAGILITPAHSLCFKYDTKSWNCKTNELINHYMPY